MVNIFFTDWNPIIAARHSCDRYVVKVPIEVALLLSAIHWRHGYEGPIGSGKPLSFDDNNNVLDALGPYKDSRVIKSSSETYTWLIQSTGNYNYAISYGLELIREYKKRYNKFHQTEGVLLWLSHNIPEIPDGYMTTNVGLAMPEKYKDRNDPVLSYRMYIACEKSEIAKWKDGNIPEWYICMRNIIVSQ